METGKANTSHKEDVPTTSSAEEPKVENASSRSSVVSGSCACASTKWASTHRPTRGSFCYCTMCRKISGGAFVAFMDLPVSSLTFSSGLKVMSLSKYAERGFCSMCGSTMTMHYYATPDTTYVTLASVEGEGAEEALNGLEKKHLYVGEKVDWYKLPDDGLPRFETMPNEAKYLSFGD